MHVTRAQCETATRIRILEKRVPVEPPVDQDVLCLLRPPLARVGLIRLQHGDFGGLFLLYGRFPRRSLTGLRRSRLRLRGLLRGGAVRLLGLAIASRRVVGIGSDCRPDPLRLGMRRLRPCHHRHAGRQSDQQE
jgi:hypothetical protein